MCKSQAFKGIPFCAEAKFDSCEKTGDSHKSVKQHDKSEDIGGENVLFTSMGFPLFLGVVAALFFLLPGKKRTALLLFASYAFCGWIDLRALWALIMISAATWLLGRKIERLCLTNRRHRGKIYGAVGIGIYVLILCIYKYAPYYGANLSSKMGLPEDVLHSLVMPVGLSFYLFQAIGYLADVYGGKMKAEKSFLDFSCYLAFFPKLVSGPIENARDFLPQVKALDQVTLKDRGRLSTALAYILWGYFMKMVVADRLAVTVNQIFENPAYLDSFWLILGMLFYTIQIYCDFAGYSYIAIGCAGIFGIRLVENFKAPYFASSITDFWRRWHISLSTWLRDYIYIPLGGNRKRFVRKCANTMVVFLVCGMWHGAGLNFVAWGLLHGIYSVAEALGKRKGWKVKGGRILTFLAVAFAWIFFRASSLKTALYYVFRMFTAGIHPEQWGQIANDLQLNVLEVMLMVLGIGTVWLVDGFCSRKKLHFPVLIQQKQNAMRYLVFYLLLTAIFIFGMYGPGYHAEQFIYMQF